jgi:hypothetical protein
MEGFDWLVSTIITLALTIFGPELQNGLELQIAL